MDTEIQSQPFSPFVLIIILVFCLSAYAMNGYHPSSQPHQVSQPVSTQGHSIYGSPSVSSVFIERVLEYYHSPASGYGETLYSLSVQYGIDPVYPLAFFEHESNLGTKGEANYTHSLGNLRCISGYACVDQDRGGYAYFNSWAEGFQEWFNLLTSSLYKGDGLTTVETIIPRYAPSADNNDESAYINSLLYCVNTWHTGQIAL